MAQCAPLFTLLFEIFPNGVLPTTKLVQTLQKMHLQEPITSTKDVVTWWSANFGAMLRAIAGKFRSCHSPENFRVCVNKVFMLSDEH